jgi:hypothetical protein
LADCTAGGRGCEVEIELLVAFSPRGEKELDGVFEISMQFDVTLTIPENQNILLGMLVIQVDSLAK